MTGVAAALTCFIVIQCYFYYRVPKLHPIDHARQQSSAYRMVQEFIRLCDDSPVHCILVDPWILKELVEEKWEDARKNFSPCRYFCRNHIYTFAIRESDFRALNSAVLFKLKKAGYDIRVTSSDQINGNIPTHINLRYHDNHAIHLVILHNMTGWWWFGPDSDDEFNLDFTKSEGALAHFDYDFKGHLDGIEMYMPHYPKRFLDMYEDSFYIPCNKTRAKQFYQQYPRDESKNATYIRELSRKALKLTQTRLDEFEVPYWIHNATLLGWLRQCEFISKGTNVEVGVYIKDHHEYLPEQMKQSLLVLEHKFGRVKDSLQYAYHMAEINLVLNFFYENRDGKTMWTGDTDRKTGRKYKYTFNKPKLCWTAMGGVRVRVPCDAEAYITSSYGKDWFSPSKNWDWRKSPLNVAPNGQWKESEVSDVIQLYDIKGKRLLVPEFSKDEL